VRPVALDGQADGTTRVTYDADAVVGGTIGGVGQRVLGGVARRMAGEFFSAVDAHLTTGPVPATAGQAEPPGATGQTGPGQAGAESGGPVQTGHVGTGHVGTGHVGTGHVQPGPVQAAPTVFTRPAPAPGRGVTVDVTQSLPAVLVGAAIALVGVLVGWRIARRR
jgi:uncharacterized protein